MSVYEMHGWISKGEFQFGLPDFDENGEYMRSVNVPWTTIKKIMARIGEYAETSQNLTEND